MTYRARALLGGVATMLIIVAVIAVPVVLFHALRSVSPGEVALHYGGGRLDRSNGRFIAIHGPGNHIVGLAERVFPYPTSLRDYTAGTDENERETLPVRVSTRSNDPNLPAGPQVDMEGTLRFFLNTNESTLPEFHELHGYKHRAFEGFDGRNSEGGWLNMLNALIRTPLQNAMAQAARDFSVEDFTDSERVAAYDRQVGTLVTQNLERTIGEDFFCGPSYRRGVEACPDLVFQSKSVLPPAQLAEANLRLAVAQRNQETARVEARTLALLREQGLDGYAYVLDQLRKDGQAPQVWVIPSSSPVAVNPQQQPN